MSGDFVTLLALVFIGSIAGLAGGVVFLAKKSWAQKLTGLAVPFAAGVLLSVSLLHLLPESVGIVGENGYLIALVAMLVAFVFEQYLVKLHHHDGEEHGESLATSVPLVIAGDTIHNFIDGVAIASAFLIDPSFGLIVALSTFLHETPHEIGDFGVLMAAGWSRQKTFVANLFSALATLPGALWVYFYLGRESGLIGVALAVSAGIFLYLGASDFLPQAGHGKGELPGWKKFLLLFAGVVIMYSLGMIESGR